MTPKERASKLAKDMVYAYEVGATMKDLDGVVYAWTKQAEQAITAAVEEEREACAKIADEMRNAPGVEISPGRVSLAVMIGDKIRARGNNK